MVIGRPRQHGDSRKGSRYYVLNCQYNAMIYRAKNRESCSVLFENYSHFKQWAIDSGWKKEYYICRKGDTGNYEPDNIYFGTAKQNVEEAHALKVTLINPEGQEVEVYNLSEFCRTNNLGYSGMYNLINGKIKRGHFRRWTLKNSK